MKNLKRTYLNVITPCAFSCTELFVITSITPDRFRFCERRRSRDYSFRFGSLETNPIFTDQSSHRAFSDVKMIRPDSLREKTIESSQLSEYTTSGEVWLQFGTDAVWIFCL